MAQAEETENSFWNTNQYDADTVQQQLEHIPSPPTQTGEDFDYWKFQPITDDQLTMLTVKELNQRLQGYEKRLVIAMKQKRRTLKNRGYAMNCRIRRLKNHINLEVENQSLRFENNQLRDELKILKERLQMYEMNNQAAIIPCPSVSPPEFSYAGAEILPNSGLPDCKLENFPSFQQNDVMYCTYY